MMFSSKENHPNTGLYYYSFRFYDPNLQRWLNQDPITERGGINLYGVVANNPINFVDPEGLLFKEFFCKLGHALYDLMMGPEPEGKYNQDTYGAQRAQLLGGIDRNDNVLRDAIGGGVSMAGDAATDYVAAEAGVKLLGAMGGVVCKQIEKAAPKIRSPFPVGARFRFSTRKAAREAAERASPVGKAAAETGPEGPHYHPLDGKGDHLNHDHYYFPDRFW